MQKDIQMTTMRTFIVTEYFTFRIKRNTSALIEPCSAYLLLVK
jgi:hypothetical protein